MRRGHFGYVSLSAQKCFHVTVFSRKLRCLFYILPDCGKPRKIIINKTLRLLSRNISAFCKARCPHTVKHAEIESFCAKAHVFCYFIGSYAEDLGRGHLMNIPVIFEVLFHFFVIRDVGGKAQFHLRIIKSYKLMPLLRYKPFSYFRPPFAAYRNILQIRL